MKIKRKKADDIIKEVKKDLEDRGIIKAGNKNGEKNGTRRPICKKGNK